MQLLILILLVAWQNIYHNKKRFLAAFLAIAFAVSFMFLQQGFQEGLLNSNIKFIQKLNADLIMVNRSRYASYIEQSFQKIRLYQAKGFQGVEATYPLYITMGIWKNLKDTKERSIRVFAFNPADVVFLIPDVQNSVDNLHLPNTLLADKKSFKVYGYMDKGVIAELSNRQIQIIGTFELGADYVTEGNLIMSDQNFLRIFAERPSGFSAKIRSSLDKVDLGLIKLKYGTNINSLVKSLNKSLPQDIKVFDKQDFIQRELKHWNQTTSVGFVFGLGKIIGFIVGMIIVYNIIYTDINNNLPQYATLKAMGYSTLYLQNIIFIESIVMSFLGFVPGFSLSVLIYKLIANVTGLLMQMSLNAILSVLLLTICMCILASLIASRRLHNLDPAELYGQKF
ncbi:MAG: ABC transporter permease DevC [Nostoc indistinguendum CM1-VF10]|jgi:putative ABC transport system permease protein|nr:ABC transporter permease DevC [Nostoc indistinguendum CM1-VF10]